METEEISVSSHCTAKNSQKIFSRIKKDSPKSLSVKKNIISSATKRDILEIFENNEQYMEYYLSLKDAIGENRIKGDLCVCDPRDLKIKERLELVRWKPRVIVKFDDEANLEEFGFSNKQIALDKDDWNKKIDTSADVDHSPKNDGSVCGMESDQDSFRCGLRGCKQRFSSLASYESHYHTCHNHVCAACKSSFVSNFLLDIHLQENHDSYFQILSPRIDMFRCLVESCEQKFRTPDMRKDHLVTFHKLPANFMFHKPIKLKARESKRAVSTGSSSHIKEDINSQQDLSSSSTSSQPLSPSLLMDVESGDVPSSEPVSSPEKIGSSIEGARGSGKKIPSTVCFGRGSRKAFQYKKCTGRTQHWHQIGALDMDTVVDIEKLDFTDMIDSLESTQ